MEILLPKSVIKSVKLMHEVLIGSFIRHGIAVVVLYMVVLMLLCRLTELWLQWTQYAQ